MKRVAAVLFPVLLALAPAAARAGAPVVQIWAMLASRDRGGIDPRLIELRQNLRGLPFRSFRLLGVQACRLDDGDQCAMELPGNAYLYLSTTRSTDRYVKMHLLLNQANRPKFNADITLNHGAQILIHGTRSDNGAILIGLRADLGRSPAVPRGKR